MLDKFRGQNLAVYVVWLPVLNPQYPVTLQKNGAEAAKLIRNPRVQFESDPRDVTGTAYGKVMKVSHGAPAWDIYFVFDADAQWKSEPPKAQLWMHQLWGMNPNLLLKGPIFFEHVKEQLKYRRSSANRAAEQTFPAQIRRGGACLPRARDDGKFHIVAAEGRKKAELWAELAAVRRIETDGFHLQQQFIRRLSKPAEG